MHAARALPGHCALLLAPAGRRRYRPPGVKLHHRVDLLLLRRVATACVMGVVLLPLHEARSVGVLLKTTQAELENDPVRRDHFGYRPLPARHPATRGGSGRGNSSVALGSEYSKMRVAVVYLALRSASKTPAARGRLRVRS